MGLASCCHVNTSHAAPEPAPPGVKHESAMRAASRVRSMRSSQYPVESLTSVETLNESRMRDLSMLR